MRDMLYRLCPKSLYLNFFSVFSASLWLSFLSIIGPQRHGEHREERFSGYLTFGINGPLLATVQAKVELRCASLFETLGSH